MLNKIYTLLYTKFGPQGWWPISSMKNLAGFDERGYHRNGFDFPKTESQKLEVAVGAILTQNTSWKNVEKAMKNLDEKKLFSFNALKNIDEKELAQLIRSSGYFNQKAKKVKTFINFVDKNYNGNLSKLFAEETDKLRSNLLSIKGIGPETADSIMLYSAQKPVFVVDAYTKRIFQRVLGSKKEMSYDELQNFFEHNLPKDVKMFNEFHALLVELAKRNCMKNNPLCSTCPLNKICKYANK